MPRPRSTSPSSSPSSSLSFDPAHRPLLRRVLGAVLSASLALAGIVVATVALAPVPAVADTAPASGTPATVAADALPTWQVNGVVWAQVLVGNTVYVTGDFTKARPPGVAAGGRGEVDAGNLFAYDITTGNRVASFSHTLNAQGLTLAKSPDGTRIYVGGDFTTVDNIAHGHVAAFDTTTNKLVNAFAATTTNQVAAIAASNDTVWFGGNFFKADGVDRTRLAAVRPDDGSLLAWAPTADDNMVTAMVLTPDGSRLIVGGRFATLNGVDAHGMGSLDAISGANRPWAANQRIDEAGVSSGITSLSTDGTTIYGSGFAYKTGDFEGSFAADPSTGDLLVVNDCHGDTYDAIPIGGVLYTVSHAHDCSPLGGFPQSTPSAETNRRFALAFTTAATRTTQVPDDYGWDFTGLGASSLLHWFPELTVGAASGQDQAAWAVTGNSDYVALGGEFPTVNGAAQQGLTRFAVSAKAKNTQGPRAPAVPDGTSGGRAAGRRGAGDLAVGLRRGQPRPDLPRLPLGHDRPGLHRDRTLDVLELPYAALLGPGEHRWCVAHLHRRGQRPLRQHPHPAGHPRRQRAARHPALGVRAGGDRGRRHRALAPRRALRPDGLRPRRGQRRHRGVRRRARGRRRDQRRPGHRLELRRDQQRCGRVPGDGGHARPQPRGVDQDDHDQRRQDHRLRQRRHPPQRELRPADLHDRRRPAGLRHRHRPAGDDHQRGPLQRRCLAPRRRDDGSRLRCGAVRRRGAGGCRPRRHPGLGLHRLLADRW